MTTSHFATDGNNILEPLDALKTDGYKFEDIPASENHNWLFSKLAPYRSVDDIGDIADSSLVGQLFQTGQGIALPLLFSGSATTLAGAVDKIAPTSATLLVASYASGPSSVFEYNRSLTTLVRTYTIGAAALGAFTFLESNGRFFVVGFGNSIAIFDREDLTGNPVVTLSIGAAVYGAALSGTHAYITHAVSGGVTLSKFDLLSGGLTDSNALITDPRAIAFASGAMMILDGAANTQYFLDPITAGMPILNSATLAATFSDAHGTAKMDNRNSYVTGLTSSPGYIQERSGWNGATGRAGGAPPASVGAIAIDAEYIFAASGTVLTAFDRASMLVTRVTTNGTAFSDLVCDGQSVYASYGSTIVKLFTGSPTQRFERADAGFNTNAFPLLLQPLGR